MIDDPELEKLEVVTRLAPDRTLRYVSSSVRQLLGFDPEEMEGRQLDEFVHPEDRPRLEAVNEEMLRTRHTAFVLLRLRCTAGCFRWVETACRLVTDPEGRVIEGRASSRDATRRVLAEKALAESEERFRSAFDHAPIGMAIVDLDGCFVRVNRALCGLTGFSEDMLLHRRFQEITHPDDLAEDEAMAALLLSGAIDSYQLEKRYIGRNGEPIWVLLAGSVVRDEEGYPLHFIAQIQDINVRRQLEEQTRRELEAAEQASRAKTAFLSRLAHELRTPLNAVNGFAQVLQRSGRLETREASYVEHIAAAGHHLADIIDDLVDSTQVERGALDIVSEPIPLDPAIEEAVNITEAFAKEHGVALRWEPVDLHVRSDTRRLTQVLVNLLSNAVKYNQPGGWVVVSARETDDDAVAIAVADSGIGIGADDLRKVFLPFERLPAAREIDGTGLGLSVCASLVDAMGGTIDVESTEGAGSTFTVRLPGSAARPQDGPARDRRRSKRPPLRPLRVLHVEDETVNRRLIRHMLAIRGQVELSEVGTAEEAVALARADPPDVVLLDLNLPDRDGETVIDELEQDERTRDVPVVVISATADAPTVKRLTGRGIFDYLTKPVQLGRLLTTIDTIAEDVADRANLN